MMANDGPISCDISTLVDDLRLSNATVLPVDSERTTLSPHSKELLLSVIIPARNSCETLRRCLEHLAASDYSRYETIVVDDASEDDTADVAMRSGAQILRRTQCGGPAKARNDGFNAAGGEVIVFLDADVCVQPNTLSHIARRFSDDPHVDAIFGAYDTLPQARNFVSQYKNLLQHFVHHHASANASTFWAGCGAVKRQAFLEVGGFDSRMTCPSVEDIEFGLRLCRSNKRIKLERDLQVKHLKKWTLPSLVASDFWRRAVPWTVLLWRERHVPNDLNLTMTQRACAALAIFCISALAIVAICSPACLAAFILLVAAYVVLDNGSYRSGTPFYLGTAMAGFAAAVMAYCVWQLGSAWLILAGICLFAIIVLNARLYLFFARMHGVLFAILAVPLHVVYYFYSVGGLVVGTGLYAWQRATGTQFVGAFNCYAGERARS